MSYSLFKEIGNKTITLETGKLAEQANGAVTVRCGDTILLVTAGMSREPKPDLGFFPLTVDFEERMYAAGKIPGGFPRREGRPGQDAILASRLTDRTIRPLFPKGLANEVQIISTVLSADQENLPEVLSLIGASAAIGISNIPFESTVAATRVGKVDGNFVINPTYSELENSALDLVVAGTQSAIVMVEAGSNELTEEDMLEALRIGQEANVQVIELINDLVEVASTPKLVVESPSEDDAYDKVSDLVGEELNGLLDKGSIKGERNQLLAALETKIKDTFSEEHSDNELRGAFDSVLKKAVRSHILDKGIRPSGRAPTEIRDISCEVGVLPRTHGSGLFQRGTTQVLTVATLGSTAMKQKLDSLNPVVSKRYMHHYNFPPFSVGETKRMMSPGRREIGHGALAERALLPMIPSEDEFPYTIRLVSEVLSSNGSTSMASACGSTLALMDAGVPIKDPVAGIAMGLIMGDDGRYSVLTDIEGIEDHLGDMDFKVAGTNKGITALQMDIKVSGLTLEVLQDALQQAREARLFILEKMVDVINTPREVLSEYAPKLVKIFIPSEKIGAVIGSGGKTIRSIQEETGAEVNVEDDGGVVISAVSQKSIDEAKQRIEDLTREAKVGDIFTGKVSRIVNFGAFIEILPGKDGLARSGELGDIEDDIDVGQEVTVLVTEIDSMGRINLSRRALTGEPASPSRQRPSGVDDRRGGSRRGGPPPRYDDRGRGSSRGGNYGRGPGNSGR